MILVEEGNGIDEETIRFYQNDITSKERWDKDERNVRIVVLYGMSNYAICTKNKWKYVANHVVLWYYMDAYVNVHVQMIQISKFHGGSLNIGICHELTRIAKTI